MRDPLLEWLGRLTGALSAAGVEYAVAGGLAVSAWAEPRATVDIDLVIRGDPAVLTVVRATARDAGLLQTNARVRAFRRVRLLRMLVPPGADPEPIAVDLLLPGDALTDAVLHNAKPLQLGRRRVRFASAEDTVLLKLLRDSDQDRVDIRALAAAAKLDRPYLRGWAKRLGVLTRLRRVGLR
jgi:hypothetical protein